MVADLQQVGCEVHAIEVGPRIQGSWVGTYGADGYALGAWNGTTATGDLVALPNATLALEQGNRRVPDGEALVPLGPLRQGDHAGNPADQSAIQAVITPEQRKEAGVDSKPEVAAAD